MKQLIIFLGLLFLPWSAMSQVTTHGDLAAFTLFGGGGTNAGASSTVETDEFTGAATYSLKIPVPPARGSITPNIVLNYHSQRRNPNSWVGYGWELDIGSIVRVSGDVGVDYLAGTSFEIRLAGQSESLTLVSNNIDTSPYGIVLSSGQVADLYQTKIESSFTFYIHLHQDPAVSGSRDSGWVSIDKAGTRYFFGETSASREAVGISGTDETGGISRWMLDRIQDANGNYLTVHFDVSKELTQILYQDITITFVSLLESDEANEIHYFPVFREPSSNRSQLTRKLQTINILQGSSLLQQFHLTYETSSRRGVRQLHSIQESSAADGSLPPVSFEYFGEEGMSFAPTPITRRASRDGEEGYTSDGLTFADMDGDGLVDQVIATSAGFHVYFNNGNDFIFNPERSNWLDPFMDSVGYDDPRWRGRLNSSRDGHQWLFLMDMNGDGLPDRFGRVLVRGTSVETANFRIAFNNGHGWDPPVEWKDPYVGDWAGTTDDDKALIDMNGDGLPDRVVGDHDGGQFRVYYNTGAGFKRTPVMWADPYAVTYASFDAVGKISASDSYGGTYLSIRDMNGDGLPDRLYQGTFTDSSGVTRGVGFVVALNKNGVGWGQPGVRDRGVESFPDVVVNGYDTLGIIDPFPDDRASGYLNSHYDFIDMNGDGFLDRVEGDSGSCSFHIFFYKGMSNNEQFAQLSSPITINDPVRNARGYPSWAADSVCGRIHADISNQDVFLQDFNGDGLPDRMALFMDFWRTPSRGYNVYQFSPLQFNAIHFSDTPSWWRDSQVSQPMGSLKAIHDGQGLDMAVEYFPSARPIESGSPNHRFLPYNMNLVHKIYTQDYNLATSPEFSSLPEASRHPGMRWLSYLFQGGEFYFLHARNSVTSVAPGEPGITGDTTTRTRFARFNGFQKVTKIPVRGPRETWRNYATTTYFHQAIGDSDPLPDYLTSSFDSHGYDHYAFSGKPYLQTVDEEGGDEVARQEFNWIVNDAAGSKFDCQSVGGSTSLCYPRQTEVRKIVFEAATRTSRVTYDYDATNGNVRAEHHYDRDGHLLLDVLTDYTNPSHFGNSRIQDRPSIQTKKGPDGEILRKKTFDYDNHGNPTNETFFITADGSQHLSIGRSFDDHGNLHQITDTDGVVKTIGYDSLGLFPTSETVNGPGGVTLTTTRDFNRLTGEISFETNPQGVGKRIVRDDFGRVTREYLVNASGVQTLTSQHQYTYEPLTVEGQNTVVLHTHDEEIRPDYPTQPLITENYTDGSGNELQKCALSERGNYRLIQYRLHNGGRDEIQTEPMFSADCNFLSSLRSDLHQYHKQKDLMGRVTRIDPPPGDSDSPVGTMQMSYATNSLGGLTRTTINPRGQTTIDYFDAMERLQQSIDPAGTVTQYVYNGVGDLRQVIGDSTRLTDITYDLLGRKKDMTDADMGRWRYVYDAQGRLERQIDARGQFTRFIYDALGRIFRKENHLADDSLERQEIYSYDTGSGGYDVRPGELFQVLEKDGSGTTLRRTRFSYEPDYRRTRRLSRQIPGVGEFHQDLNHDYLGRVMNTTYPGGHTLAYRYMRNGNLMQVCDGVCGSAGGGGENYYSLDPSNAFDVFGNLTRETYGNGVVGEYAYFPNSHRLQDKVVKQGSTTYLRRTYTYDETSNLTQINDPLNLQGTGAIRSASYDNLDRLTGYTTQDGRGASLEYDARGNILKNRASFGDNLYQYTSPRPHAVTQIGDQRFEYDDNGNMISDPSRRMFYNANNQLSRVEMLNGNVVHYDYDYTGARVSKRAVTRDLYHRTTTTTTHYLGDALEIKGDQITLNVYAGSKKIATRTIGSISGLTGTAGGTLTDNGIDPEMNLTLLMPYLFLFFTLFLLGSLRPWPHRSPLPRWEGMKGRVIPGWACHRERSVAISWYPWDCFVASLLAMTRLWLSWCHTFQETIAKYPKHAFSKSFMLFMILLFQLQPMSLLFADEGEPRSLTSDADYFYYNHDDHLGSSALLTEGKPTARHSGIIYNRGELLQRFEYAPFGKETFVLNPNLQFDPSYTGQKYDVETGLYYYKSRFYNPILGRFIQPDTVVPDAKNLQAYNRYTYVNNNPLKYVDPSGHFSVRKLLGAFAAAIAAAIVFIALLPAGPLGALGFLQLLGPAMAAGMTAGVIGGAISGGLTGALRGMALGGVSGAAGLVFSMAGPPGIMVMAGLGLGLSANSDGWEGLLQFGAALVGAYVGSRIGISIHGGGEERGGAPGGGSGKDFSQFEPGEGMTSYESSDRQFGTQGTIDSLHKIGKAWSDAGNTDPIQIGDMSYVDGRPMPHHAGHRGGLDVDVRPGHIPGHIGGVGNYQNNPVYSVQQTQTIVDTFRADPRVQFILFNDRAVSGVRPWSGHDNHLHVRFSP